MKFLILLACILLSAACASTHITAARMYNLNDGSIIYMKLTDYFDGFGKLSSTLHSGEILSGEFTISSVWRAQNLPPPQPMINQLKHETRGASIPGKNEPTWAEVYGYDARTKAKPVGTGVLVGDAGTVVHMVLFSADTVRGLGDGVARTNTGHWYRVYIGDVSNSK